MPGAVIGGLDRRARGSSGSAVGRRRIPRRDRLPAPDRGPARQADRAVRTAPMMPDLVSYGAFFLTTALSFGIMCLGLNLQWGHTGLFNVGVAGFVAIGAYTSALLTTPDTASRFGGFGLPIAVGWLGAVARLGPRRGDHRRRYTEAQSRLPRHHHLRRGDHHRDRGRQCRVADRRTVRHRLHPATVRRAAQEDRLLFSLASLLLVGAVALDVLWSLERLARGPWGRVLRAIREDEAGGSLARQEPRRLSAASFRSRLRHHGARRRHSGALHRLHSAGELSSGAYLPGLGDADRRRRRQQSWRVHRRGRGVGLVEPVKRVSWRPFCRRAIRRERRPCSSS